MSDSALTTKPPGLDASLGALLVGLVLGQCLYGALCVQVFCYYQHNFKNDPLYIKFMVVWCWVLETVHTIFLCMTLYLTAVTHFGEVEYLAIASWPQIYSVFVTGLVETPVQIFFAYRVYALAKWRIIPLLNMIAAVACLGITFADSIRATKIKFSIDFQNSSLGLIGTALAMGVAIDISNTVCLVWILVQNKGPMKSTRQVIDKLVVWTIETGFVTSVANVLSFIFLFSFAHKSTWAGPLMFAAKLYSNSFLASLNGRISLRATGGQTHVSTFSPSHDVLTDDSAIGFTATSRRNQQENELVLRTFGNGKSSTTQGASTRDFEASSAVASLKNDPEALSTGIQKTY